MLEDESSSDNDKDWHIYAKFQRAEEFYRPSWAILLEVRGKSRDWVVLTASELEDRASTIRKFSAAKVLQTPFAQLAILLVCMLAGAAALILLAPKPTPVFAAVEQLYSAGKLTNPIEAMILLEKERAGRGRGESILGYMLAFLMLAAATSFGLPRLAKALASPHIFYWGDYMAAYKRRKGYVSVVWTVVVLGIVVGLSSTYLAKFLGI